MSYEKYICIKLYIPITTRKLHTYICIFLRTVQKVKKFTISLNYTLVFDNYIVYIFLHALHFKMCMHLEKIYFLLYIE